MMQLVKRKAQNKLVEEITQASEEEVGFLKNMKSQKKKVKRNLQRYKKGWDI